MAGNNNIICFVCKDIIEEDDDCMILTCYEHVACGACLQLVDIECTICTPKQTETIKKRNVVDLTQDDDTDNDEDIVMHKKT